MDDHADLIARAVDKFLAWKLPPDFCPDCGVSFDGRGKDARGYDKGWPVGTNLLTADQARAMFEHCVSDALAAQAERIKELEGDRDKQIGRKEHYKRILRETESERDALRQDAERYRWLRDNTPDEITDEKWIDEFMSRAALCSHDGKA